VSGAPQAGVSTAAETLESDRDVDTRSASDVGTVPVRGVAQRDERTSAHADPMTSTDSRRPASKRARQEAAEQLRAILAGVAAGELDASSPQARAIIRRIEGAVIALEASIGRTSPPEPSTAAVELR